MPIDAKPLFRPDVVRNHVTRFKLPAHVERFKTKLIHWANLIKSKKAVKLTEKQLLPDFLTDFFCTLLGYTGPTSGANRYTISREQHVKVDGKFADAVLGEFDETSRFVVALEGKGIKDPLDIPHGGRKMSAVDQGYRYAINLPSDWIIVTSMKETRLYHKGSDQHTFEVFETEQLAADENLLKRFVFLFGAERVVPSVGSCHFYSLLSESEKVGRDLTKEFYVLYANIRQDAFEQLAVDNPQFSRQDVLTSTQKLLDRVLFCAFCEDRGLLPAETLKKAYEHRDPYRPRPIWENFTGLFSAIDKGNKALDIWEFNGGLFAEDQVLDGMKVSDTVCGYFRDLGEYDYRRAQEAVISESGGSLIDVEILGHIFEQSITDLEKLRNELDGLAEPVGAEKHKTRRKKEGAFYTPAFITRYIVEQSLGGVVNDRFEQHRKKHEQAAKGTAKKVLEDPTVYDVDELSKPQSDALIKFWESWQDELKTIRILDPACGSGAFLVEAFDQLLAIYEKSNERLEELRGHRSLFDLGRQILEHNLFGVDLNEEAIEICRLSLWIKTAEKGKPLTSLDHSIRVGNSVVSDASVHARAFDWKTAFPGVFADGGFDVIVGNPPYIRQEWLAPYKPHWKTAFKSFDGVADIFTYFYEIGINFLRTNGRLGFITSGSWVRGNFGAPLRRFLAGTVAIDSMIDFGEYQPFEEAELIRPTIAILRKQSPGGTMKLYKWLTSGTPPVTLSEVIANAPTMRTDHLGADAWELDPDDVLSLRKKLADGGTPLHEYAGTIFRGVVTGLNEVFVIDHQTRSELISKDERSAEIIKPFVQGTHMRPWFIEQSSDYLIFARRGTKIDDYPAVRDYLAAHRTALEPKPSSWDEGSKWQGRKPGSYQWYELQDTVDYWPAFEQPKIVWPDISKLPRFSMDTSNLYLGNTGFVIPRADYYLLGVLSSWASWFYISKTAQPLRLRGDRWQYRLFAQFMDHIPIPNADTDVRDSIAKLAKSCSSIGLERYQLDMHVQRRMTQSFGQDSQAQPLGTLNNKAQAWWEMSLNELGDALKTSFKLKANPFKKPQTADEWEPYLTEKRSAVESLTRQIADAEAEINDRVYKLFNLNSDEIKLLQREVEH